MTTNDQQITPADAAIVSSGTGTKGPEERDLPASLKEEMDLCLQILREVLGEFDEQLLASFDEVRGYALNASAERFAGILTDTNPDQDHSQRDESIEGQVREDLEWAARNNIIVLGVYIDRKLTGKEADRRDSFQDMIRDAACPCTPRCPWGASASTSWPAKAWRWSGRPGR